MAQYIQPLANDKYKYFLDQSTGFKMRVGQRNHFFVRDKELYDGGFNDAEDVGWENTGGYGDPGYEVVAGGRIRFGVRDCDWCDDIELTPTGFDGVESSPGTSDGDWKCVGSLTHWNTFFNDSLIAKYNSREGLDFIDELGGDDALIKQQCCKTYGTNGYFFYNDSGALDIGVTDLTMGGRFAVYQDTTTDQAIFGKVVYNAVLEGTYGFLFKDSTQKILFYLRTSSNWYTIDTGIGLNDPHFYLAEIDNTAKTIKVFVDGVQVGVTTSFVGTTGATGKPVMLATGQEAASATLNRTGYIEAGEAFIYKTLLSDANKVKVQRGEHVSGAGLFWILNNAFYAYDVSGNHLDKQISGTAVGITYTCGSPYLLNNGYTLYKYLTESVPYSNSPFLVPAVNGVYRATPLMSGSYSRFNDVPASLAGINNIFGGITFPAGVMDRSNVTIFSNACRASSYYAAGTPTYWHMTEFQNDIFKTYVNDNQDYFFIDYDDSAVIGRKSLDVIYVMDNPFVAKNLIFAERLVNIHNKATKLLVKNTRMEWENCSYYFNGKHYRVWSEGQADNWDKWIYTVDENMVISDSYLCATGCLATTDYHSMPSVTMDDDGYIYVIHEQMDGNDHGSDMLLFKSNNPEDITAGFTQVYELTGQFSYPQLMKSGSDIFLNVRVKDEKDIGIYKLNSSDEFDRVGAIWNGTYEGIYKSAFANRDGNKLGLVWYTIDAAMTDGVYYAESADGIIWYNGQRTVSVDLSAGQSVSAANKASFQVHSSSGSYNSIISENGIILDGVPHVVVYEGNRIGETEGIEVENVYIAKMVGGSWVKHLLPTTTPMTYAQKAGFNHFISYVFGKYYLWYINEWYDAGILTNSKITRLKSTDLITWTSEVFAYPDYSLIFLPTSWMTHNAPNDNQLIWFMLNNYGYQFTDLNRPYSQHFIYKLE